VCILLVITVATAGCLALPTVELEDELFACSPDVPCPDGQTCVADRDGRGARCKEGTKTECIDDQIPARIVADGTPCGDGQAICVDGSCLPARCGDGVVTAPETCDGGNGCRSDCTRCGDAVFNEGESCDNGEQNSDVQPGACRTSCALASCGDGVRDPGEGCDDGIANDDALPDACRTTCARSTCGDGIVDTGEGCDDGVGNSDTLPGACRTTCVEAGCGDDVVDPAEQCDNGSENSDVQPGACRTTCRTPACGDGIRDPGEACDSSDGCRSDCTRCGDGALDAGESCDNGEQNSDVQPGACRTTCALPTCGDGVRDPGEGCDEGNANDDERPDACRTTCAPPTCGDRVIDDGEACDDGTENNDTVADACRTTCAAARCGDGVVDENEACDNGSLNSDVQPGACRTSCVLATCGDNVRDPGEGCDGSEDCRSDCSRCGDGVIDVGEQCDNGNNNSDVQPGACRSTCVLPVCGDGVRDPGEGCDDGTSNSDATENACRTTCARSSCGDGVVDQGEACDDGVENSNAVADACRTTCAAASCGDGVVDENEACDNGSLNSDVQPGACRTSCFLAACGDNVRDPGEGCDGTDDCRSDCSRCGDGVVDAGEECDNGNNNSDTQPGACRSTCALPVCGDGVRDPGEGCDDGTGNSDTTENACRTTCARFTCGDGVVDQGEACDDGVENSNAVADACRTTCAAASCGDGVVDENEACDNGSLNSDVQPGACRTSCFLAACGDNVRDPGEGCDGSDGCRSDCSRCGDGIVDAGEQCDNGENNSDVRAGACRTTCVPASCGDNIIDPGETCDDGPANSGSEPDACRLTCVPARCGDGVLDSNEKCDDGEDNGNAPDACRATCIYAHCGDGIVDSDEGCDSGDQNSDVRAGACRTTCRPASCGDGVRDPGEGCDAGSNNSDSNLPGVFCRRNCLPARCGDGVVEGHNGELCDDGNTVSGDGCRGDCRKVEECGDRALDPGEACDDGNENPRDGCDECRVKVWTAEVIVTGNVEGTAAQDVALQGPSGVARDVHGRVFIADATGHRVRRVNTDGTITLVAGDGSRSISPTDAAGDGGAAGVAQLHFPRAIAVDSFGRVFIADTQNHRIRRIDTAGIITTIAGTGVAGFSGDSGPAVLASLNAPEGIALDPAGRVYIADTLNHRVRRIDTAGRITTIAGTGAEGFSGDGGEAPLATLRQPAGLAVSVGADGVAVFVADRGNHRVRRFIVEKDISTYAGSGVSGSGGDGGPAINAQFGRLEGLAVDRTGRLLIVDSASGLLRRVARSGTITTIAGGGPEPPDREGVPATTTRLVGPRGVVVADDGDLYIAEAGTPDGEDPRVRRVEASDQTIHLFAGTGLALPTAVRGPATTVPVSGPGGIAFDATGRIVFAETFGHQVRRLELDGTLTTIAGTGSAGYGGDGGPSAAARLDTPYDVVIDGAGRLFIADAGNHRVRLVDLDGTITTFAGGAVIDPCGDPLRCQEVPDARYPFAYCLAAADGAVPPDAIDCSGNESLCDQGFACLEDAFGATACVLECSLAAVQDRGFAGDGGTATESVLNEPRGLALDGAGRLYIADTAEHLVRRVDLDSTIDTVAGNKLAGALGDGGPAKDARLSSPVDVVVDGNGRLFISDVGHARIRMVAAGPTPTITTVAGTGAAGSLGDGNAATSAQLRNPRGLAVDGAGRVLLADGGNHRIRRFAVGGSIERIAGTGVADARGDGGLALLGEIDQPQSVVVDPAGRICFSEADRVRCIDGAGIVATVAGGVHPMGPGPIIAARLYPSRALVALPDSSMVSVGSFGRVVRVDLAGAAVGVVAGYKEAAVTAQARASFAPLLDDARGVAFDPDERRLVVTEFGSGALHVIGLDPDDDGIIDDPGDWTSTVVSTSLVGPAGIVFDPPSRGFFVVDEGDHCVRAIERNLTVRGGPTEAVFGECGVPGLFGRLLSSPTHAVLAPTSGALYIADTGNHRVLRLKDDEARVVIGDGSVSSAGEGAPAHLFPVNTPRQLALDDFGNLYVTSATTIRLVANVDGDDDADSDDRVITIFGGGARATSVESDAFCLRSIALDDEAAVFVSDACHGFLVRMVPAEPP
jgi:cysteine-rich repeat protein